MNAKNTIAIALICMILLGQYALNDPAFHPGKKPHDREKPSASPIPSPTPSLPMMAGVDTTVFTEIGLLTH